MNIETVKISTVKSNPNNPRVIKDDKFDKLVQSIKDFPQMLEIRPIVVNDDMIVLGGNMRLKACKEAGLKEVPIIKASDLTEEQQREFIIKDNVGFGEWDWEQLKDWDGEELEAWGLDVPDFEADQVLEAEEDDFNEAPPENPITVLGDLYEIGEHRLLCGDSTDSDQVAKLMNGEKADMVFTDPPYGINEKGDRSKRGGLAKGNNLPDFIDDSIQYAIDAFNQPQNLDIPIQVWFGANYYCHSLPQGNNWLVWDKRVEDKQRDTQSDCELAWVKSRFNSVRIFRHLWKGMMKDSERGQRRVHATQKPIALIEFALNEYGSKEGDLVIDYFTGSGSTMVASHQLNRKCYGMELDPKYCDVIVRRMIKLDPTLTVKRNGIDCKSDFE
jgi:DNA modification methylase